MNNVKSTALQLRKQGLSLDEIVLKTGVARSTVYGWIKSVSLSANSQKILYESKQKRLQIARTKSANTYLLRRQVASDEASRRSLSVVNNLADINNLNILVLALLYWCEGGKDTKYGMHFINSDPVMVGLFMSKLRSCFDINEDKIKIMLHLHNYHIKQEVLEFWSEVCRVPITSFFNPYIKPHTALRKKEGYMGCVSIRYHDKKLADLLSMVYTNYAKL